MSISTRTATALLLIALVIPAHGREGKTADTKTSDAKSPPAPAADTPAKATAKQETPAKKPAAAKKPAYDEKADAKADLANALAAAKRENRRVLIQWGGNWCPWCVVLHERFKSEKDVGLKHAANDSLETITGKSVATADEKAWREVLNSQPASAGGHRAIDHSSVG